MRALYLVLLLCLSLPLFARSWIGDAGHFFVHNPTLYANNPRGQAFTVTVHRNVWPAEWANTGDYVISVKDPDGVEVGKGTIPSGQSEATVAVPAGTPGVYTLLAKPAGYGLTWVECSLDQLVIGTGEWAMKEGPSGTSILHVIAPRRWYFFVPQGTERYQLRHTVFQFQSHREDYGLLVMNPRGQRVASLFGGKSLLKPDQQYSVQTEIEPDPGTAGRFWSIWACGGDSHNFSDLQIQLNGVPPFLASTPEQWFDPRTGKGPESVVYDNTSIRVRDTKNEKGEVVSRDHYLVTPTPYLGDEDYNGWRGPATIYYRNPENRAIDFGIVTYITPEAARLPVKLQVFGPSGKRVLADEGTYTHHTSHKVTLPAAGAGVYRVQVDAPQWLAWAEPAPPMVIAGAPITDARKGKGARYSLETGIARHWFFKVPKGTKSFYLDAYIENPDDVLLLEVHAPDRLMDVRYIRELLPATRDDRTPAQAINVPDGMDDKIWFVRMEVGSASRLRTDAANPRQLRISATLDLYGVPSYLAPTWEQWFDPER